MDETRFNSYCKLGKLMLSSNDYREQNYAAGYVRGLQKFWHGNKFEFDAAESILNDRTKQDEARGIRDGLAGKPPEWLNGDQA